MAQQRALWISIVGVALIALALVGCGGSGGGDDGGSGEEVVQDPVQEPPQEPPQDPVDEPVVQGIEPPPGSQLGDTETFSWDSVPDATEYWVHLGTTMFGQDICCAFSNGLNTSITISDIPQDVGTIYLRIWYLLDGSWASDDFTYTTTGDDTIAQCDDNIDNDGDGLIDLDDPGCTSASDNDETDEPALPPDTPGNDIALIDEPFEYEGIRFDQHELFVGLVGFCFVQVTMTDLTGTTRGVFCDYNALDSTGQVIGDAPITTVLLENTTRVEEGSFGNIPCQDVAALEFLGCDFFQ